VRKYSRAQVLEHRLINHDINHVTSNNMDSARLERWVDNDGCGAQNASRGDSELTAREHAMKHGYWTGTYQPEVQEYLAYSAELSTLSPSAHNQDTHPRWVLRTIRHSSRSLGSSTTGLPSTPELDIYTAGHGRHSSSNTRPTPRRSDVIHRMALEAPVITA